MKDFFNSIFSVFKERTENPITIIEGKGSPFGGTYLFIWCMYNWQLIYMTFNFDSNFSLHTRFDHIDEYFCENGKGWAFVIPLGWTFVSLFSFYISSSIALAISQFYHSIIVPKVTKTIAGKSAIKTKAEYDKLEASYHSELDKKKEAYRQVAEKEGEMKERLDVAESVSKNKISSLQNQISSIEFFVEEILNLKPYYTLVASNESIIFTGSPQYPILGNHKNSIIVNKLNTIHHEWENSLHKFEELKDAFWISDRHPITVEEAIAGGTYNFACSFRLDFDKALVDSITFNCIVDDKITIQLNGNKKIKNSGGNLESNGYGDLSRYDITNECAFGDNKLLLEIKNASAVPPKTGSENPYGVAFSITLKLKNIFQLSEDKIAKLSNERNIELR